MNHFFVYGTLMHGLRNYHLIEPFVQKTEKGSVSGTLYHLHYGYPALILDGKYTVLGELIRVRDENKALQVLDALEDYYGPGHPDNHYERRIVQVNGVDCYVYEWILPLKGIATLVPGQDWRRFIENPSGLE